MHDRSDPPFVITGTGRCGTHWIAEVLGGAGLRVGHEERLAYRPFAHDWARGIDGEVGWPAAAHLQYLDRRTRVIHLVRDPLAVMNSRLGNDKLAPSFSPPVVRDFVTRVLPDRAVPSDPIERCVWFVTTWDELVVTRTRRLPCARFRVEDLADPAYMSALLEFIGVTGEARFTAIGRAAFLPSSTGSLGSAERLRWADIPDSPAIAALVDLAVRDGYLDQRRVGTPDERR